MSIQKRNGAKDFIFRTIEYSKIRIFYSFVFDYLCSSKNLKL